MIEYMYVAVLQIWSQKKRKINNATIICLSFTDLHVTIRYFRPDMYVIFATASHNLNQSTLLTLSKHIFLLSLQQLLQLYLFKKIDMICLFISVFIEALYDKL